MEVSKIKRKSIANMINPETEFSPVKYAASILNQSYNIMKNMPKSLWRFGLNEMHQKAIDVYSHAKMANSIFINGEDLDDRLHEMKRRIQEWRITKENLQVLIGLSRCLIGLREPLTSHDPKTGKVKCVYNKDLQTFYDTILHEQKSLNDVIKTEFNKYKELRDSVEIKSN